MVGPVPASRASHLERLLSEAPDHHLLVLGLLAERGPSAFRACVQNGELAGVVYLGPDGLAIPAAVKSHHAARELGASLRDTHVRVLAGERATVGGILSGLDVPRVPGRDERLYTITADDMGPFVTPELRKAEADDVEPLVAATEAWFAGHRRPEPAEGIPAMVESQVRAGRTWVIRRNGAIAFRADVAGRSRHGAHLDLVWTAPELRRQGLGALGLGQLARTLLSALPRLTVLAADADVAAAGLASKVGFVPGAGWRSVEVPSLDEVDAKALLPA